MSSSPQPKILVVDDEAYLRDIITFDLKKIGLPTLEAGTGKEALEIVKTQPLDLIISDVRMPSGSGLELLSWVRSIDAGEPAFILMTAFSDISAEGGLALGAQAFLRKPVEKDEMIEAVRKALVPRAKRWETPTEQFEGARRIQWAPDELETSVASEPHVELGQGGMFLEIAGEWPACFEVIEFDVPCAALRSGRIGGFGCVRWVRREPTGKLPAGVGLEFLALSPSSRSDVVEYLGRTKPHAYVPLG